MLSFISNSLIQHLGYIFTFLALSVKDVLWLRMILALAQILLGIYQFLEIRYDVVFWNTIFTFVNIYHIIRIINERKPIRIPNEIKDLYKSIFYNMTTKEFIYFWNIGSKMLDKNISIIKEGEKQKKLYLILSGLVSIKRNEQIIGELGRGNFIAEMSLITEEPASADAYLNSKVSYMVWDQSQIRHFQKSNPNFWIKLNEVLSRDLIKKINK